jgi:hypothetical protein
VRTLRAVHHGGAELAVHLAVRDDTDALSRQPPVVGASMICF